MSRVFVCHYSEIGLKGKNRSYFENILIGNIKKALKRCCSQVPILEKLNKRLVLRFKQDMDNVLVYHALKNVFGLVNFSAVVSVEKDLTAITQTCLQSMSHKQGRSFVVSTKRSDKNIPYTSPEINRKVGAAIVEKYGNPVDLKKADVVCHIEILPNEAFIFTDKISGPGGLPVGSSGQVLALLSGGFDSPVAAYYAMRRGAHCSFLHFHVYPFTEKQSQEKVKDLARALNRFQFKSRIYMVPFAETQQAIAKNCPEKFRIVLYRRMMMRIAEQVAENHGYKAVVTGDSLGQVASQTLENLAAVEDVIRMPVLRPLIGLDKNEIMAVARTIGTYDISIRPHDDACTRFMPKQPSIRSKIDAVREAENALNVTELSEKNLRQLEIIVV